ncbi:MAG TPA: 1-deoxy-D-xylulose-5-phosphate synthase [Syntrophomonadaceae bacterium]|nr:1-deoxy-D-xylulose-5-phosphate synthase [Syntrophomonadaceae bacterium]HPR92520.1 1-deoxy-D-xylulose-5-phosphate synthase [Syntrophomonadaceae bacterium]
MREILELIEKPQDIKKLSITELYILADEIRRLLVNSVAECGGHLAANLGVVELTIALHYIFDSPQDKIIWDVGHQSYIHKILTGRREQMKSLRKFGGISGFPKVEESEHDAYNTGHASTSISAALGMAIARDIKGEKNSVVACIGDGALTGGVAFEALNHAGQEGRDLIVLLNDNEMSISRNVGAMSSYLNRLRTDPSYSRTKEEIETALHKIPGIGPNIAKAALRFKDMVKYMMVPGKIFEELGFTYIGPVNGHDLSELNKVLGNARKMKGPILIHVITQKGKGYEPALKNPHIFHGIGPFDIETGSPFKKAIKTYTEVFGDFMIKQANEDERLVAITAAMADGTGLAKFARRYPERFFDVGICEQHAVTMAAGMARAGLRPVVAIYSSFLQRSYDQLVQDIALQNLPVVIAVDRAGLVGEDGPTHHGVFDLAFIRSIPNFTFMAPANENELANMLYTACQLDGPVAIRYPRGVGDGTPVNEKPELLTPGKGETVTKGDDLTIIAIGRGVSLGKEVRERLSEQGINSCLVNARFIKPLDKELIKESAVKNPRLVTIEDGCLAGGFGSAVIEMLNDENVTADVLRFGFNDEFVEHGKAELLFDYLNMDAQSVAERIISHWPALLKQKKVVGLYKIGEN